MGRKSYWHLALLILLALQMFLVMYYASTGRIESNMVAWLSVIVFVLFGVVLLKWQPLFFILMFYLYYAQLGATFSGALIEKGI